MEVMARYGGGGGYGYGDADVAWKVGRIMLKFRPIAPKPVTGGTVTAAPVDLKSSSGRGKRKGCSKEGRRGRKSSKKAVIEAGAFSGEKSSASSVVTLPLMPVTPERKEESPGTPSPTASDGHLAVSYFGRPSWQHQVGTTTANNNNRSTGVVVAPRPVRPIGSWVTVECVTDTWRQANFALASPAGLDKDACPIFFSDAYDRVTWTNAAYKRMVVGPSEEESEEVAAPDGGEEEEEVRVALVTGGLIPGPEERVTCFTCRVRVRYACRRRGKVSLAVPCDVWRLADGGLAWRLDVKAALSLSLGS